MKGSGKAKRMDLYERPVLDQFGEAIDLCREELQKVIIREEVTYHYAVVRVYSKMILTSCAIHTLLINGYPDDALSLCRHLYECLVIINTLLKGKQADDKGLLERFMDAPVIAALMCDHKTLKYVLDHNQDDEHMKAQIEMINEELKQYKTKYQIGEIREFREYWWSGYNTFSDMADHSDFPRYYAYSLLSNKVHMNALGVFHYLDDSESGLLIGSTNKGKKQPLWFSSLFLYCAVGIIHDNYPEVCPINVIDELKRLSEITFLKER